jgi:hypothetical protein
MKSGITTQTCVDHPLIKSRCLATPKASATPPPDGHRDQDPGYHRIRTLLISCRSRAGGHRPAWVVAGARARRRGRRAAYARAYGCHRFPGHTARRHRITVSATTGGMLRSFVISMRNTYCISITRRAHDHRPPSWGCYGRRCLRELVRNLAQLVRSHLRTNSTRDLSQSRKSF